MERTQRAKREVGAESFHALSRHDILPIHQCVHHLEISMDTVGFDEVFFMVD